MRTPIFFITTIWTILLSATIVAALPTSTSFLSELFELAARKPSATDKSRGFLQARSASASAVEANILAPIVVGLYVCTDADWKGDCAVLKNGPGLCINFDSTFAGKISSLGPDEEVSGCTLFEEANCKGTELSGLKKPGEANLGKSPMGGKFNDSFQSYICY